MLSSTSINNMLLTWLWIVTAAALPAPHPHIGDQDVYKRQQPPPSQDPFYQPDPSTYTDVSPGTILNSRQIETLLDSKATYQVIYRSTDSLGQPSAVVSTLLVPQAQNRTLNLTTTGTLNQTTTGPTKLLSLQFAYDSAFVDCSPSWAIRQQGASSVAPEPLLAKAALKEGWTVSIPDYEGFLAAFTNGVQSGQATLDSLRAAISPDNPAGITPDAIYSMAGGSGGALASEWALELQPSYAPELRIASAALGSLTPDVRNVFSSINQKASAGLSPASLIGITIQNATYNNSLYEQLVPETRDAFLKARSQCLADDSTQFAYQDINKYFVNGYQSLTSPPLIEAITTLGVMGKRDGVPTGKVPIFAWKGTEDEISPVADTDNLISQYCDRGARIQYKRFEGLDHAIGTVAGVPDALLFLTARFAGVPFQSGCSTDKAPNGSFDLLALLQKFGGGLGKRQPRSPARRDVL